MTIIEIGPGIGALTEVLIEEAGQVIAIEIDQRLIPILEEKFSSKITLLNDDFLKVESEKIKKLIKKEVVEDKMILRKKKRSLLQKKQLIIVKILIINLQIDSVFLLSKLESDQHN